MILNNLNLCPNKIKHQKLLKHAEEIIDLYINQKTNDLNNLTIACRSCNAHKGTKTDVEFQTRVK